jgi:RNA polymerase sigma factor (sigma-70 family)
MASKRRRPGALPPKLTDQQEADARRCYPLGVQVAMYFALQRPAGLSETDLLSAANEAVVLAVCTHSGPRRELEGYVWIRVRSTLLTLIEKAAVQLGLRAPNDTYASRVGRAGSEGLNEYALAVEDPGDVLEDSRAEQFRQYDDVSDEGAAALACGGAGHAWHMRGEEGFVLRAEYVRGMRLLHNEVAALSPEHATVMELRFFREMKMEDVAKAAGVSLSTVTRLIGEAIPRLEARLRARGINTSILEGR